MTNYLRDAKWITHQAWAVSDPPLSPPTIRTRWEVKKGIVSATIIIAAVGIWSAHLGKNPVSNAIIEPGVSEFKKRVALAEYDVTNMIKAGSNEFILELGEGPAHVRDIPDRYTKFSGLRMPPRAQVALVAKYPGHTEILLSDESWQAMLGPSTFTHWYGGEDYDSRLEPKGWLTSEGTDDSAWEAAVVVEDGPSPWIRVSPPTIVTGTFSPTRQKAPNGAVLFDAGRNLAGRPVLRVGDTVPEGTKFELWPAEYLHHSGTVDQNTTGGPIFDTFTTAGKVATFKPRFGYHGFRYVELRAVDYQGNPIEISSYDVEVKIERIQTNDKETGSYSVSDPVLSGIYSLITNAAQSNLVGVPTDCPHREKLGWLEQDHLVFEPLAFRWDICNHFTDMIQHMEDAQTKDGLIPDIAPELVVFDFLNEPGYRDDVNWGSAIWQIPFHLYRTYGDLKPARLALTAGRRYIEYIESLAGNGLLDHGLSDWIALDLSVPRSLVASYGFHSMLLSASELENAVGDPDLATHYRQRAHEIAALMRHTFVVQNQDSSLSFASGSQSSISLLLDSGILHDKEVKEAQAALLQQVADDGEHITVGEIALPSFIRALINANAHELLYRLVTDLDAPSYGRMLADGETSLCEHWTGRSTNGSGNHFMLGYISDWLTGSVAGLSQDPKSRGWEKARFRPAFLPSTNHAEATYESVRGKFGISWTRKKPHEIHVKVEIPTGSTGEIWNANGKCADIPSGTHQFSMVSAQNQPNQWTIQ